MRSLTTVSDLGGSAAHGALSFVHAKVATVGETVALAVRRLRQDRIGEELTAVLTTDEVDWLDADLG